MALTMETLVQRLKQHKQLTEEWDTEKEMLNNQLSVLIAKKAAIDLCRKEMTERIESMQQLLGQDLNVAEATAPENDGGESAEAGATDAADGGDDDGDAPAPASSGGAKPKKRIRGKGRGKKKPVRDSFS